jgi:hypothetical protein
VAVFNSLAKIFGIRLRQSSKALVAVFGSLAKVFGVLVYEFWEQATARVQLKGIRFVFGVYPPQALNKGYPPPRPTISI